MGLSEDSAINADFMGENENDDQPSICLDIRHTPFSNKLKWFLDDFGSPDFCQ